MVLPDEDAQRSAEIAERIGSGERPVVPAFWPYEVLNALMTGERRNWITPELTQAFIQDLTRLPIDIESPSDAGSAFGEAQWICRKHGLTAYDASYLGIAIRSGVPLATLDQDLQTAAVAEGVRVL